MLHCPEPRQCELKIQDIEIKTYLYRCLASVVGDHEVHGNVFTIHVLVNPVSYIDRHHVGE